MRKNFLKIRLLNKIISKILRKQIHSFLRKSARNFWKKLKEVFKKIPGIFRKNSYNSRIKIFGRTKPFSVHPIPLNPAFKARNTLEVEASQGAARHPRHATPRTTEYFSVSAHEEGNSSGLPHFNLPTTDCSDCGSLWGMRLGSVHHLH